MPEIERIRYLGKILEEEKVIFLQIKSSLLQNFSYLIGDEKSGMAAVVDPPLEAEKILSIARENKLMIAYVINTHTHGDHVAGNERVASITDAKIVMHKSGKGRRDIQVEDGDEISLGHEKIKVIHTPGHSPDGICLLVGNRILTGDTLFVGECGRTDLPGGSSEALYESLFNKLLRLPDELEVYPGHDYGPEPCSTLGFEKRHNYTLRLRTKEEFVSFMAEL